MLKDCFLHDDEIGTLEPLDAGDGWTIYINWIKTLDTTQIGDGSTDICAILAYISKIKGYKESESPRVTHDEFACKKCNRRINLAIYRYDAGKA